MNKPLPNFICIGAQKAGTTTIYSILEQHPDILLSIPKETDFFQDAEKYEKGIDAYSDYFRHWQGETAIGEIEPDYFPFPEVPGRIKGELGDSVKLFAVLRNPIDRAYSHYQMNRRKGYERLGFLDALDEEEERVGRNAEARFRLNYAERGRYAKALNRYLALFPSENLKVYLFEEDFLERPKWTLHSIQEHIGVVPMDLDVSQKKNVSRQPIVGSLGSLIHQKNAIKSAVKMLLPSPKLRGLVRRALEVDRKFPPIERTVRRDLLAKYFMDDIRELESILGRSLDRWTT